MTHAPSSDFQRDTIFALASAEGRAGVAIVRVSGPKADAILQYLTRGDLPGERKAVLRTLYDKKNGGIIDRCLVLRFCRDKSYNGDNIVEFHIHGGRAVISAILGALAAEGLRVAEPGEFTRRAVENGRLDLTQAEAIADLVDAETEAQRRQAMNQLGGKLSHLYEAWRTSLIRAAAWIEAGIDFADEEIPDGLAAKSDALLRTVLDEIRAHLADGRRGEILREGLHVAVIGPPNAGKSSLVNALARRDVAIVSPIPGTTRDVIEVRLDLKGYPVILADTAGLREAKDAIEDEGIRRALARAETADLRLLILDGSINRPKEGLAAQAIDNADLIVWNKADLVEGPAAPGIWVSAATGGGLDDLIDQLAQAAQGKLYAGDAPLLTRARHRQALEGAEKALAKALEIGEIELKAENVRTALHAIGRITGRVDLDELLDVVFRDYCIGK